MADRSKIEKGVMAQNMSLYDILTWEFLRDKTIPTAEKVRVLMPLACKHVKTEIDISQTGNIVLTIVKNAEETTKNVIDDETVEEADTSV